MSAVPISVQSDEVVDPGFGTQILALVPLPLGLTGAIRVSLKTHYLRYLLCT